jgi:hypothetical protein
MPYIRENVYMYCAANKRNLPCTRRPFGRVGLEACPLSQWIYSGLAGAGLPVVCIEVMRVAKRQGQKKAKVALARKTGRRPSPHLG